MRLPLHLVKPLLDQLFREMADNGAYFGKMVLFCGAYQKQMITNLYAEQSKVQFTRDYTG